MKHIFTACLFVLLLSLSCLAQSAPPRYVLVQMGIGFQWFGEPYKLFTLSAEHPVGNYWHLGLQSGVYLPSSTNITFDFSNEFLGGFELGGFAKYFLHGRFSGRKSGLYLGPELRYGKRKWQRVVDVFTPPFFTPSYQNYDEKVTKILLRWGVQWQFGHACLELSSPFGLEFYNPTDALNIGLSRDVEFVMLPTIQLGIGF